MEEYLTKTEIRYSQVNSGLHVTLLALAQIIEDATTKFLEQHHLSGGFLNKKYGAILVVLRNHIYFHDRCHSCNVPSY
jgi:acyl-CoA thioesterase FadM